MAFGDRDPAKARAWQQRSAEKAQENRRARAIEQRSEPRPKGQAARSGELKRTGELRARSPRKRERYASIAEACGAAIERDGGRCQARLLVPEIRCGGKLDPQHVIPQGVRKDLAAEPANIVGCCRRHHDWIGDHPIDARALGLHGHSGDDLAELAQRRSVATGR